ncbi:MAG: alpha/beta hydrolase [Lachnospiraceae bacterium]|nr:alpha/beta hydrolase [Lachnospiraceae bacterium]
MWMIKHIFDGDFGCEERAPGQEEMMVSVTLENDQGEVKYVTVADAWLTEKGLDVGAVWPKREENMLNNKTLKEVLEDPRLAKIAPDAISKWDLSAEEFYNWTLQEINDKMGWGSLEFGFTRLFEIADRGEYYFPLYTAEECQEDPEKVGRNIVYIPSDSEGAGERPYIFLVPGGGFYNVWSLTEGWPVARHFNELGYNVFVLTYRVMTDASAVKAMEDTARAMEIIKSRKDQFGVDPDKYITCGFSAGGYIICLWNTEKGYAAYDLAKPVACFPIYPATSYRLLRNTNWDEGEDEDQFARQGLGCTMEEAINSCFEIPEHVEGFPPTAIFVTAGDELVDPEHSKMLARALDNAGIPCRLEVGPTGGHGFADGTGMCMEGWPKRAIEWFEQL